MNYRQSVNIAAVFLLLIFGFAIATVLKPSNERSETENRLLEQKPDLTWNALISGKFSEDYEAYLSDQFVVRDGWISLKTAFERAALRQEAEDVYFARDNYLIEKHTGVFTAETAERNIQTLSAFFTNLSKSMDPGHLTAMVVPNAVDILRDKLRGYGSTVPLSSGSTAGRSSITGPTITGRRFLPIILLRHGPEKRDWPETPRFHSGL